MSAAISSRSRSAVCEFTGSVWKAAADATPRTTIERPHNLRHGRPVRVGHIDRYLPEPSFLDPFGMAQMRAVSLWESLRLVLPDSHVVYEIAVPVG
jgi:hypothetical protein